MTVHSPNKLVSRIVNSIEPPSRAAARFRSIFIIGYSRSGKSLLADELSRLTGGTVFRLDTLRGHSTLAGAESRRSLYNQLLHRYPGGVIIEGDNLIGENKSGAEVQSPGEFIQTINHITAQNAEVVMIGNAEASVATKKASILQYREKSLCWTSKAGYTPRQVENLAERGIAYSSELREWARSIGRVYLEIRPDYFERDIMNGALRLQDLIRNHSERNLNHHQLFLTNKSRFWRIFDGLVRPARSANSIK